eukprot:TRINITY_DN71265_c0_g1_i1.p1 TRINITY_DN71265_c0_g1~~TRINITY_DN71265_c0_g1_i1.p1  ORF type:complete len:437 (-),score=118.81 TRINITY_DN71265_c0_g1_i1:94-1344(-)
MARARPPPWPRLCLRGALFAPALLAVAFDIDAHDAIGQTAASAMDQEAIRQVKRLLDGKDASDVAGWGHQVDDTFPGMERLHFQAYDDKAKPHCGAFAERQAVCEDNICLLQSIRHFYGKVLQKEGRKIDYPAIDYEKAAKGVTFSDVDSLKMLINLLGDLHQPLHLGFVGDDMGRSVKVNFRGNTISLYDLWDRVVSETVRNEESNFWLGGWTHVRAVQEEFEKDKAEWKSEGAFKMFDKWAAETADFACREAYVVPRTGKKLAGPGAESGPVEITAEDYQQLRKVWLRQILVAGERTAIVLNDILDAASAARLREGAAVKTNADKNEEEQKKQWAKERDERLKNERRSAPSSFQFGVFLTNLSIAAVVVPVFLLIMNGVINPVSWIELLLESASSAGGGASSGLGGRASAKRWE